MLNKKVCKLCHKKDNWDWVRFTENLWNKRKKVYCVSENNHLSINKIPSTCPYKLEHLLKGENNAK
jgi:hypothetical protein